MWKRIIALTLVVTLAFPHLSAFSTYANEPAPFTITADSGIGTLTVEADAATEPELPDTVAGRLELTAGVQQVERDFDQTAWITVYNPTENPIMYYLVSYTRYPVYELALNFVYTASVYEPTVILSGETQQVQLSVFTQSAMRTSYQIPIVAYVVENGSVDEDTVEILTLQVPAAELDLTITQTGMDANTLTRTFSIRNDGSDIPDLTLSLAGDVAQVAHISPGVEIYQLAQNATLTGIDIVPDIAGLYAIDRMVVSGWLVAQSGGTTYDVPVIFDISGLFVEHIPLWRLGLLQDGNPFWDLEIVAESVEFTSVYVSDDGFDIQVAFDTVFGNDSNLNSITPFSLDSTSAENNIGVGIQFTGEIYQGNPDDFEEIFNITEDANGDFLVNARVLLTDAEYNEFFGSGGINSLQTTNPYNHLMPLEIGVIHWVVDIVYTIVSGGLIETATGAPAAPLIPGMGSAGLARFMGALGLGMAAVDMFALGYDLGNVMFNPNINLSVDEGIAWSTLWLVELGAVTVSGLVAAVGLGLITLTAPISLPALAAIGIIAGGVALLANWGRRRIVDGHDERQLNRFNWFINVLGFQCSNIPRIMRRFFFPSVECTCHEIQPHMLMLSTGTICQRVTVNTSSRMGYGRTASGQTTRWDRNSTSFASRINGVLIDEQTILLNELSFVDIPIGHIRPGENIFQRDFTTNPGHFFFDTDTLLVISLPADMELGFIGSPSTLMDVRAFPDLAVYTDNIFTDADHLIVGEESPLRINFFNRGSVDAWYELEIFVNDTLIYTDSVVYGEYRFISAFNSNSVLVDWTPTQATNVIRVELTTKNIVMGDSEVRLDNNIAERTLVARTRQTPIIGNISPDNATLSTTGYIWATAEITNHLDIENVTFAVNSGAPTDASIANRGAGIRASAEISGLVHGANTITITATYNTGFNTTNTVTATHTLYVEDPTYVPAPPTASFTMDTSTVTNPIFSVIGETEINVDFDSATSTFSLVLPENPSAYHLMVIGSEGIVVVNLDDLDGASISLAPGVSSDFTVSGMAAVATIHVTHVIVGNIQLPVDHNFYDMDRVLFSNNISRILATVDFAPIGLIAAFSAPAPHVFDVFLPYSINLDPLSDGEIILPEGDDGYLIFTSWPDRFSEGQLRYIVSPGVWSAPANVSLFTPATVSPGALNVQLSLTRAAHVSAVVENTHTVSAGGSAVAFVDNVFDGNLTRIGSTTVAADETVSVNINNMTDMHGNRLMSYTAANYDDQLVGIATFTNTANPSDVIIIPFEGTISSVINGGSISMPLPDVTGTFRYAVTLSTDRDILPTDPVDPVELFALTISAGTGGTIAVGTSGEFEAGTIINIQAQANATHQFVNWTSTNGGVFANATNATTTFTMPANATTITANFSLITVPPPPPPPPIITPPPTTTQPHDPPPVTPTILAPRPTISANNGAVDVTFRAVNDRMFLEMPTGRLNELVNTAVSNTVIFDVSDNQNIAIAIIPRAAMQRFVSEGLSLRIIFADGAVELSTAEMQILINQIRTGSIFIYAGTTVEVADDEPPTPVTQPVVLPSHVLRFVIGQSQFTSHGTPSVSDAAPFIADDRAMVPLRVITEALGASVDWDDNTRTVTIIRDGVTLNLVVDQPLPGGMGTPVIVNDRTFVPTRYVSETLGAALRWDEVNRAVYVY